MHPMLNPSDINDMLQRLATSQCKMLEVSETQALAGCDVQEEITGPVTIAGPPQFHADSAVGSW